MFLKMNHLQRYGCRPSLLRAGAGGGVVAALLAVWLALPACAANVTLKSNDAVGTSSFTGSTNWSSGGVPAAGNAYYSGGYTFRTPADATSRTFAGDSLSIDAGGRMLGKTTGTTQVITVTNLLLNGGNFEQASVNSDNAVLTWTGNISVNAASGLGALGGTANGSGSFETLNIAATISGAGALQVGGTTLNAGQDSGFVRLSAANPYSGTITVSNAIIASTVNRLLQLNHLNALSNATLGLNSSLANPLSFAAGVNTGPFNVGALAGTATQVLADTAGLPVALSIGGKNGSSAFAGGLTGAGSLVKVGAGTQTLAGANTYSGGTTVSGGTLQMASLNGAFAGGGSVILMAPSALTPQNVSAGAVPFSGKWVVAGGWLAGMTNNAFGTNSITVDPMYPLDPSAGNPTLAGTAWLEPKYDLNSAGTLTMTNGGQLILHQNCAFTAVLIEGTALASGTHSYQELATNFPGNIAAGGAGYLTVQPFGTLPPPPPQAPRFLAQPVSQTNFTGMTVQFNAPVYGSPAPTYQWQAGAVGSGVYTNLANGGPFAGVTNATLFITNITLANAASYVLVASNSSGVTTSSPAVLTVLNGAAVIRNATGVSVGLSAGGVYTIASTVPAWTFSGSVGQVPQNLISVNGTDAIGSYAELRFGYTASAAHYASIRLYTNQPVVLFADTSLAASVNDLAFPRLTNYPAGLYHLGFNGEFAPPTFTTLVGDSPWLFFDTNFNTFVFSPATNFMVAGNVQNSDGSLAGGINSAITQLPAGFTHRTLLTIQPGINQAFTTWGNALTGLSGKVRPANDSAVELNKLGYWTDNGATYYYNYSASLGYAGTLLAVRDGFATNGLPLGYMQLDSWWYPKGVANTWQGDATNNRGGVVQYIPDPTLFPNGLPAFRQQLGLPLFTHCRWIDGTSPYRSQYAMSQNVIVDYRYWTNLMASLKAAGVTTFEHDWLDVMALPVMNLNDPPAFMNEMAAAAAANGINLQYCMELPRHYLQSSLYTNLLTLRVSIDRFEISKWDNFLYCSRLANAVGAWPWTDVYPSSEARSVLLGTLSAGPVGVGDALGAINTNILSKAVRPDGVIVKPDVALAPTDQTCLNDAEALSQPMVASTYVDHDNLRALYVFAYARTAVNTNAGFVHSQLGLSGSAYIFDRFNQTGTVVTNGGAFSFSTSLGGNNSGGSFFTIVPIGTSGIAFLGDTNKFVSLGKKRISVLTDTGIVKATVVFAANETNVTLWGYAPTAPYVWTLDGAVSASTYDPVKHIFSFRVAPGALASALLAVSLSPPPFLQITNLGGNVQVFWPAAALGYTLESATSLAPPVNWLATTNPVSMVGDRNTVNIAPTARTVFYRLKQ